MASNYRELRAAAKLGKLIGLDKAQRRESISKAPTLAEFVRKQRPNISKALKSLPKGKSSFPLHLALAYKSASNRRQQAALNYLYADWHASQAKKFLKGLMK